MPANRHLAPVVDTTLLKTHVSVVTDTIGALSFPVKSKTFPPTLNLVQSLSSVSVFTSHTIFPYVIFVSFGTCVFGMKINLFVPFTVLIPWAQFIYKVYFPNFHIWAFDQISVFLGKSRYLMGNCIGFSNLLELCCR